MVGGKEVFFRFSQAVRERARWAFFLWTGGRVEDSLREHVRKSALESGFGNWEDGGVVQLIQGEKRSDGNCFPGIRIYSKPKYNQCTMAELERPNQ
jgi:hypothetical protein